MKKLFALIMLQAGMVAWVPAQLATNNYPGSSLSIPDGNTAGVMEQFNVNGLEGVIANIRITLDITGGFNGDLYAYLAGPQGQFAVLLNRAGLGAGSPFGYANAGFAVTFDDSSPNIHNYQDGSYSLIGGQLTGNWAPDGRNIDPQSSATVFDTASTGANFSGFLGFDPNGTWTFFIADLSSGGGSALLNSLTLSIVTVPEPQAWVMFGGGLMAFCLFTIRRKQVAR